MKDRNTRSTGFRRQKPLASPLDGSLKPIDLYNVAIETRNFEIKLFWERCNYFLVLNSGLAFAYFGIKDQNYLLPVALFGVVVCFFWLQVALGSKFWQSRWEQAIHDLEKQYFDDQRIAVGVRLFSASPAEVKQTVETSFQYWDHHWFASWIDRGVIKKPSVSLAMMKLILIFLAGWVGLALVEIGSVVIEYVG